MSRSALFRTGGAAVNPAEVPCACLLCVLFCWLLSGLNVMSVKYLHSLFIAHYFHR